MITGTWSRIIRLDTFLTGLSEAQKAVVLVSAGGRGVCTGWCIAPGIVIAPGFAFIERVTPQISEMSILVEGILDVAPWEEPLFEPPELLGSMRLPGNAGSVPAVAVLRLSTETHESTLSLGFAETRPGQVISILHFPEGKPQAAISIGSIVEVGPDLLAYDADTLPGSSGGPVFDEEWRVVGMHFSANHERRVNQGLTRAVLLATLQLSGCWPQIAHHHRIADVAAGRKILEAEVRAEGLQAVVRRVAPPPQDEALVRAAVCASFPRSMLTDEEASRLKPQVVDASAERWVLQPAVRQSVIRSVGSLQELEKRLPREREEGPAQRVIEQVLAGPPYDLAAADEESLSWWIQASRWFAGVAPSLPSPAEITRALERRRVRSRLDLIAGAGFRGRAEELETMRAWFAREPAVALTVSGIGGIGKSALVARFASDLPPETLILWLDFDRADLAPDDAVSVLRVLGEQAAVQLEGFEPPAATETDWHAMAVSFGNQLAGHLTSAPPPLLVLDSFEMAQYAERYQELWPVLEAIATSVPSLRLIVTGRAPVQGLLFLGRAAQPLALDGLRADDARAWLREQGIEQADVLDRVIELADGIPLILRLALQLFEAGGSVGDLPEKLPREIVAGFLYDRILDRVQNLELKPLAMAALVLRRLTPDMIEPVLGGLIPFPPGDPALWFEELGREMALVEGTDVLRLRPEVRSATLLLIEREQGDLVRQVDERAERWYAQQDVHDPEVAAELVYHRLRLGDLAGAGKAWRDECGPALQYAAEDLRSPEARSWLEARLGVGTVATVPVRDWEQEAAERIRAARARGLARAVPQILTERTERSADSPLVFQEAFELRASGDRDAALGKLTEAGDTAGPVGRDRALLRALLAADAGDRGTADEILARVEDPEHWVDRRNGRQEALAVSAARIHLATDLDGELELLLRLRDSGEASAEAEARQFLSPIDVLLPLLQARLGSPRRLESWSDWTIPGSPHDLPRFAQQIEKQRREALPEEPEPQRLLRESFEHSLPSQPFHAWAQAHLTRESRLMVLSRIRWALVSTRLFLAQAYDLASAPAGDPVASSILGTLALFAGDLGGCTLVGRRGPVFRVLQRSELARMVLPVSIRRWERTRRLLREGIDPLLDWDDALIEGLDRTGGPLKGVPGEILFGSEADMSAAGLTFHLCCPDPLEQLVHTLAGDPAWIP